MARISMWQNIVERWKTFTKEQKLSVLILSVCGVLAIGISMYQMNENVRGPFMTDKASALAFKQGLAPTDDAIAAKQQRTDTDGDGISDWDEVNTYHTNPNLKDTCGDGIPDNVRIATGRNLTCTGIGNPGGLLDTTAIESTSTFMLEDQSVGPNPTAIGSDFLNGVVNAGSTGATSTGFSVPRDPAAIRAALQGSVDQAKLDAVTDAQLLKYYDTALAEQQAAAASSTATP